MPLHLVLYLGIVAQNKQWRRVKCMSLHPEMPFLISPKADVNIALESWLLKWMTQKKAFEFHSLSLSAYFIFSRPYLYKAISMGLLHDFNSLFLSFIATSSLCSKSQSLTNTFNIPETPAAQHQSPSQDEAKAETIRNLRKSFASLFSVE